MNTILLISLYIPNLVLTVYLKFNMKKYASKFGESYEIALQNITDLLHLNLKSAFNMNN